MRAGLFGIGRAAAALALLPLALFAPAAEAQNIFGQISGTVTDASGAVLPGVQVSITNEETKLTRTVTSNETGFYVAPDLPVGSYRVSAGKLGFQGIANSGNDLVAGGRLTVNLSLNVGSVTQDDRRNIFVTSYSYDSPFFKNLTGIAGNVLSGWQLSGIVRAQSGQPLTVSGSQTIGPAGSGVLPFTRRANIVSGIPLNSGYTCLPGKFCSFNPAAFAASPLNGVGNAPTGNILGPGYYAWDLSLRKSVRVGEGKKLSVQADAVNAFNHPNWGNPGITVTGPGFGQVGSSNPPRNIQFAAKLTF